MVNMPSLSADNARGKQHNWITGLCTRLRSLTDSAGTQLWPTEPTTLKPAVVALLNDPPSLSCRTDHTGLTFWEGILEKSPDAVPGGYRDPLVIEHGSPSLQSPCHKRGLPCFVGKSCHCHLPYCCCSLSPDPVGSKGSHPQRVVVQCMRKHSKENPVLAPTQDTWGGFPIHLRLHTQGPMCLLLFF